MADVCSKEPSGLLFKVDFAIYFLAIQLNKRLLLIKKSFFLATPSQKKSALHQGGEASELSANLNEKNQLVAFIWCFQYRTSPGPRGAI